MISHHTQDVHHPRDNWLSRLRLGMLIALLTLGLGIAAVERFRLEEADIVWNRPSEWMNRHYLDPIRQRTYQSVMVIFKLDRLWVVEAENQRVQRDLSKLTLENQILSEELGRLNRLSGLGQWSGPSDLRFLSCDVIGLISNEQSDALLINHGRADGVNPGDPVVSLGGLVGIVQKAFVRTARVQAITDPLSAVGAIDRKSRARGVVYGKGRNEPLWFIPENEIQPIEIGAVLVSSGFENSIYPKGVVVGVIQDRKQNRYGMHYGAVKPAVGFEALEEVLLVIPKHRARGGDDLAATPSMGHYTIHIPSALSAIRADTRSTGTLHTTDTMTTASPPLMEVNGGISPVGSFHHPLAPPPALAPMARDGADTGTTRTVAKPVLPQVQHPVQTKTPKAQKSPDKMPAAEDGEITDTQNEEMPSGNEAGLEGEAP